MVWSGQGTTRRSHPSRFQHSELPWKQESPRFEVEKRYLHSLKVTYCWWKKSCTTWDGLNFINNGIIIILGGAGFPPSTVAPARKITFVPTLHFQVWFVSFREGKCDLFFLEEASPYIRNEGHSYFHHIRIICFLLMRITTCIFIVYIYGCLSLSWWVSLPKNTR